MANIAAFSKKIFEESRTGNSPWPIRIFLCLAVLISYANVWPNEFVFDDKGTIVWNTFLKSWSNLPALLMNLGNAKDGLPGGFYRPLQMLAYFLIYQTFGPSTIAFHALNIALQAFNACLLHHFGVKAGFRKGAAFAAALLWAVHPLHTSDVAYAASTAELLQGSFCLLGLIALLPDFTPYKISQAMIFFVLALSCKESAVVFPALAVITFFFVSKDRAQIPAYLKTWLLWLLAAGYITVWQAFMHKSGYIAHSSGGNTAVLQDYAANFPNRVLTSLATLPVYARLIVWPTGLHIERIFSFFSTLWAWQPATGALIAGLGCLQIFWMRLYRNKHSGEAGAQRGLALSFGLLWFAAALSPYTGIVVPIDALLSEGWMYVPTMGLFLGMVQTASGFFEKRQTAAQLLVLVLALSLGTTTFLQDKIWRNPETLYQNILQNDGRLDRLSYNLGLFYMEQGEFDKAAEQFQYKIDRLSGQARWADIHLRLALAYLQVRLDGNDTATLNDVIRALPSSPHIPEAITELGKAVQDNPDFYQVQIFLAAIYYYQGNNKMGDFHQNQANAIWQKQRNHSP